MGAQGVDECKINYTWYIIISGMEMVPVRPEVGQAPNMMDIGTRRIYSEEHDMFRQTARRFFQEEVLPHHAE